MADRSICSNAIRRRLEHQKRQFFAHFAPPFHAFQANAPFRASYRLSLLSYYYIYLGTDRTIGKGPAFPPFFAFQPVPSVPRCADPTLVDGTSLMADTPDQHLHRVIAAAGEILAQSAADVRDSAWMPQELAAQIAESMACAIPGADTDASEEFMNAWVAACEAVAARIRAHQPIKSVELR